jgi:hypothetical protein
MLWAQHCGTGRYRAGRSTPSPQSPPLDHSVGPPPQKRQIVLDVRSLDEVLAVILPVKGRLGHRLIEPGQEGLRIDGLYLDLEWLQFSLKRLGDALQSMLARGIGG